MSSKLILMRHGKSIWNQKNLFTGWVDIPLCEEGIQESIAGGKEIREIPIDIAFTSTLVRAQTTLVLALLHHSDGKVPVFQHPEQEWSRVHGEGKGLLPVYTAWELNERMYGKLQGLNKAETAKKYGEEQVHIWRRSFDQAPPEGESLKMTAERTIPYFKEKIIPCLEKGQNVFVAAHGNSLRSIVMHMRGLSGDEVVKLEIPTGKPLIYTYDRGRWSI